MPEEGKIQNPHRFPKERQLWTYIYCRLKDKQNTVRQVQRSKMGTNQEKKQENKREGKEEGNTGRWAGSGGPILHGFAEGMKKKGGAR